MEIGIDIGTSYSSIAILTENGAMPIKVSTGQCGYGDSHSIPSAVFVKEDGTILIGQAAVNSRLRSPANFKNCFKRDFGMDVPYLLGEHEITVDRIYIEFLTYFRKQAELLSGESVTKAYLTHPANYTQTKKERLTKAAVYSGLTNVELLDEPTAAAMSYFEKSEIREGETLLVYDFGGGTFDLALMQATANGFESMTHPLGLEECGGVDFDNLIYDYLVQAIAKDNDITEALQNIKFRAILSEESIKLKHKLSYDDEASVDIPYGFGEYLNCLISQTDYNAMIEQQVRLTCQLIGKIAENAGIALSDITKTLCVGGTSRTPYVKEMVEQTIGKKAFQNADPELAICCGAAVYSGVLNRNNHSLTKKSAIQTWIVSAKTHTIALQKGGTVQACGNNDFGQCNIDHWKDIVSVSAGEGFSIGLKSDGSLVVIGNQEKEQTKITAWKNIVGVKCGKGHTVGLNNNGMILAVGKNTDGQCKISDWKNIIDIAVGDYHTVGVRNDGTVIATGWNQYGQCQVDGWSNIIAVAAGSSHTVGLKKDGSVVCVGKDEDNRCQVSEWKNIIAIAAGSTHTAGLMANGKVLITINGDEKSRLLDWENIIYIACGGFHTVGVRQDGTVVSTGMSWDTQCYPSEFYNIGGL